MTRLTAGIVAASLLAAPAQAQGWRSQAVETQAGAFVGARLKLSLGGAASAPRAALTLAPTQRSVAVDGTLRTHIGEGLAVGLAPDSGLTLTLAGVRADQALGMARHKQDSPGSKLGLSTGGKIALGVGIILVAGGVGYLVMANRCTECDQ